QRGRRRIARGDLLEVGICLAVPVGNREKLRTEHIDVRRVRSDLPRERVDLRREGIEALLGGAVRLRVLRDVAIANCLRERGGERGGELGRAVPVTVDRGDAEGARRRVRERGDLLGELAPGLVTTELLRDGLGDRTGRREQCHLVEVREGGRERAR